MGTDYGLYCLDCRDHIIFEDRGTSSTCLALIALAPQLQSLKTAVDAVDAAAVDIEVVADYGIRLDLSFFQIHGQHKLTVVDEYGREWPTCNKVYQVEGATRPGYCNLKKDHEKESGEPCSERSPLAWY